MSRTVGADVLDDPGALAAADPGGMLREVCGAPAQFREAMLAGGETDFSSVVEGGRPRAVVVAGMGGSGISGDLLAAVAGPGCPVPISTHRGYGLPGWVGPTDIVIGVSCSGTTEETLAAVVEADRRGARVVTVGAADSTLAEIVAKGPHVVVPTGRVPRASLWALSVPLLVLGEQLGLTATPTLVLNAAADLLDVLTERYRPDRDVVVNPAKRLALALHDGLPVVWGCSPLAGVAAYRFAGQLAENADAPSMWGVLPEANHNQVVAFDSPDAVRLQLVLLRDVEEHEQVAKRAAVSREIAEQRGIAVHEVSAEGTSAVDRIASLVAMADFASTYLALHRGINPSAMAPITELKARIAR